MIRPWCRESYVSWSSMYSTVPVPDTHTNSTPRLTLSQFWSPEIERSFYAIFIIVGFIVCCSGTSHDGFWSLKIVKGSAGSLSCRLRKKNNECSICFLILFKHFSHIYAEMTIMTYWLFRLIAARFRHKNLWSGIRFETIHHIWISWIA